MKKITKAIGYVTSFFNVIAVIAIVALMLLVCANVIMRYVFQNPIPGTYEITQMLMICLSPCMAVTIMSKQCIWVDVFTSKLKRTGQMVIDIITLPASVVIIGMIAWQAFNTILSSYAEGTYKQIMTFRLYEWPFRIVFFLAMAVATLAALAFTIERFMEYKNGGCPVDETDVDRAIAQAGDMSAGATPDAAPEENEGGAEA